MKALYWKLRARDPRRWLWAWRRAVLLARFRLLALWFHASIDVDLASDLRIGRHLKLEVEPDTRNVVRIGAGSLVGDRVHFELGGGTIEVGRRAQLRKDVTLKVSGRLVLGDHAILGHGTTVHCAESVVLAEGAGCAEYVTLADSSHFYTEPDELFWDNVRSAPIVVGASAWLCPKATVTSGVTIGDHVIVGAGSVVHRDVPDGHLASGVPIGELRRLDLPWERSA